MLEGPRGSGKSTILRAIARQVGGTIVDLDDEVTLAEIRAGSDVALTSDGLIAIDEFQRTPEVLSPVKTGRRPAGWRRPIPFGRIGQ